MESGCKLHDDCFTCPFPDCIENSMLQLKKQTTHNAVEKLDHILDNHFNTDVEAMHYIGNGWTGEESVCMALYAVIKSPNDIKKCLQISVNHDGDSDSVGCIAGGIMGAMHGTSIIPREWVDNLAEKRRMYDFLKRVNQHIRNR